MRRRLINENLRERSVAHAPLILPVGWQEVESRTVSLRRLGAQGQQVIALDEAVEVIRAEGLAPDLG